MGQGTSKHKLARSSSERIDHRRKKIESFKRKGTKRTSYSDVPQLILTPNSPGDNNNSSRNAKRQHFRDHKSTNTAAIETKETANNTDLSSTDIDRLLEDEGRRCDEIDSLELRLLQEIEENNRNKENIKLLEQERNIQDVELTTGTVNTSTQTDLQDREDYREELEKLKEALEREKYEKLCEIERNNRLEKENHYMKNELEMVKIAEVNLRKVNDELRNELEGVREELGAKRDVFDKQNEKFHKKFSKLENEFRSKEKIYCKEYACLKEEFERLLQAKPDFSEKESLKSIIDMKREEIEGLKKTLAKVNEDVTKLRVYETKSELLKIKVEQLEHQINKKSEREQQILAENKKLEEYLREEANQKRRALQFNEELQWKLRQNKEVIDKILGCSDNVRNITKCCNDYIIIDNKEEGSNFKKARNDDWNVSVVSPRVKSVIEKSESLSYALDLNDDPDVVANRIIRRSFRQSFHTKNKSNHQNGGGFRKNSLSHSASSSAILTTSNKSNNADNFKKDVKDSDETTLPKLPINTDNEEGLSSAEGIIS